MDYILGILVLIVLIAAIQTIRQNYKENKQLKKWLDENKQD